MRRALTIVRGVGSAWVAAALCALPAGAQESPSARIEAMAGTSACAGIDWRDRGRAPAAYFKGIALVFAKALCQPERADVKVVSAAPSQAAGADSADGLAFYDPIFRAIGLSNEADGADTLRHAYTMLIGLGMRESSGKFCVGRDRSAEFDTADSAEAGLFQTSWGVHVRHPSLGGLFQRYKADTSACLLDTFQQGVRCSAWDARIWGNGDGAAWQALTKSCPAFATEYGAVVLRTNAGRRGEFGPIRTRKVEIRRECDAMLSQVQAYVRSDPGLCQALAASAPR